MKKLLCLFLCIWAFHSIASAEGFSAHCPTGQTLFYEINSEELTVTVSYDDTVGGTVVIPSTVYYHGTYWTVTRIKNYGFYNVHLMTSVTIPNTVTYIGGHAFAYCAQLTTVNFNADSCTHMGGSNLPAFSGCTALTTLNIGENVKVIPADGFIGIGITSVTIPHNVQSIGWYAFGDCTQLATVNFNADSCYVDDFVHIDYVTPAFYGCTSLTTLNIGDNVKVIPALAFYNTGITSVTIPHNVQSIGNKAFGNCTQLTTVNFNADSCTYMGGYERNSFHYDYPAFYGCTALTTLNIGNNVKVIPSLAFYYCNLSTPVTIPNTVTYIGSYAFCGTGITSATIGENVQSIGEYAFYNTGITSVTIPHNVKSIGERAFGNCSQLTTVNFNADSCTYMRYAAFAGCTALTTLNIGDNVKVIPNYVFEGTGITSVTIPQNVQSIGDRAFADCTQLTTVNFNADSCTFMGDYHENYPAFSGCTALSTLNIGENVRVIPENAFYGTGITSVTIPHNVQSIGDGAFADCTQLTTVNFNADSCTYISGGYSSDAAFAGCTALTTLNIGDNVKVIPDYAFNGTGITSVTIPHNVKNIGYRAFANCTQLTTVNFNADSCTCNADDGFGGVFSGSAVTTLNIGDNVIQLPDHIFRSCSNLATVNFGNSVRSIGRYAFAYCSALATVNFGNSVRSIGRDAFRRCSALSTLELPASLERIGPSAFQETHLTSIVIPQQVSVIDSSLFTNCYYLTSVVLPDSLEEIKYDAFYSCSALDSIIIPNSVSSIESRAFIYCDELTHVVLPDSLAALPTNVFNGCSSLPSITIPSTVTQIGNNAFAECTSLQRITMLGAEPPTIANNTFMNVPTNVPIFVPCGASDSYRNAGFWSNFINYNEDEGCFLTLSLNCNNAMMGTLMGAGRYSNNSNVTVAAVPYIGYQFLGWNDGNTTNPRTVLVSADTTFTATFAAVAEPLALHNVTVMSSNASMGSAVGSGVYQEGCSLSIMALPNSGYAFSAWHDGNTDNPRTILVNSDGYYIASFVSAPMPSDTILVHDTTFVPVYDTTFVPVYDTTFVPVYDTTFVLVHDTTFVPVYDTTFVPVYDTTFVLVHDTTFVPVYDTTFVPVYDTTIITVIDTIVQPITYFDLNVISGNVSQGLVAGNGHFPEGTTVEIAAIPMEGYRFKQWNDGNTDNPRVVEVTGNATYEASFDAITEAIGNVDNQEYLITTDKENITIQGAAHQRIRIFDCLGRLLVTETDAAEYKTFQVPASGAYLVQVGNAAAKKVVVIK